MCSYLREHSNKCTHILIIYVYKINPDFYKVIVLNMKQIEKKRMSFQKCWLTRTYLCFSLGINWLQI